jgi:hypothetical protein
VVSPISTRVLKAGNCEGLPVGRQGHPVHRSEPALVAAPRFVVATTPTIPLLLNEESLVLILIVGNQIAI